MAEKLPEGAGAGAVKHNRLPPLSGMPVPSDISVATKNLGSPRGSGEPYLNRSSSVRNKTHLEVGGTRLPDSDAKLKFQWVEQDEPGVYITLTALPGGSRDLKRIRFSRRRFSETQAAQWWQDNRARVYELYNVRVVDKSVASTDSDVENLTRKSHLLEVELERTEQFKEAISIAGEETAKCKVEKKSKGIFSIKLQSDSDAKLESEWVEQDEPGVCITLTALPGGARDLKRIRFSRKRFSEIQAEQWWEENRARVYEQYKVRDKSVASIDSDVPH